MAAGSRRSRETLAEGFTAWFSRREGHEVTVAVTRPGSGLSSETLLLQVTGPGGSADYVARLPPIGELLFPDYELARQASVQNAVAGAGIPVPEALAMEDDPSWVGAPFLLMPRLPGRILGNNPPWVTAGWIFELAPERQAELLQEVLAQLARIHQLPVDESLDLSGGGPTLSGSLDYWDAYVDWASDDKEAMDVYRRGLAWLRAHEPSPAAAPVLLWGDPQIVNLIFDDDGHLSAVLDWEMAGLGPAEVDLAWFLTLYESTLEQMGVPGLPGFGDRAAIIAAYEELLGRSTDNLDWYDVFAHVRAGAIVQRIAQLTRNAGRDSSWTAMVPHAGHIEKMIGAA